MLELTQKEKSFVQKIKEEKVKNKKNYSFVGELKGEIIDPKCYFGVMKPGDGKVHKSCAIRCISGGIPPVFRVEVGKEGSKKYEYYLIINSQKKNFNKDILQYVADTVVVSGTITEKNGWKVLDTKLENIRLIKRN